MGTKHQQHDRCPLAELSHPDSKSEEEVVCGKEIDQELFANFEGLHASYERLGGFSRLPYST
jgi:hypothetical protein